MSDVKTYCYEYQPRWFSYPIEPVDVGCGITLDKGLCMYKEGENVTAGEVQAKSLRSAKMKVSRIIGMKGGRWERGHLPRKEEYFPCHLKDNQNRIYLWEKTDE